LRASTAFRVGFDVCFFAAAAGLVFASRTVLFDARGAGGFAIAAFAFAFDGAASRAAAPAGAGRGVVWGSTSRRAAAGAIGRCLRNSRAASS
jgi:hypothetical protein